MKLDKDKIIVLLVVIIVILLIFIVSTIILGNPIVESQDGNVVVQLG
jgi:hypothetical protein|tara:strand:- start:403 stop:543 length:141 start_codon:yes stop_codon:yes gene_type:complete